MNIVWSGCYCKFWRRLDLENELWNSLKNRGGEERKGVEEILWSIYNHNLEKFSKNNSKENTTSLNPADLFWKYTYVSVLYTLNDGWWFLFDSEGTMKMDNLAAVFSLLNAHVPWFLELFQKSSCQEKINYIHLIIILNESQVVL